MLDKTSGPSKAATTATSSTPFLTRAEAEAFLAAHPAVESIQAILVDIHGKARGKIVKREALGSMTEKASPFRMHLLLRCLGQGNLADGLVYETGDKDNHCFPIRGTLHVQPWSDGSVAQMLIRPCDPRACRTLLPAHQAG